MADVLPDENLNSMSLSEDADKKLSNLLNEIKELLDNDDSNDELEKTFNKSKTELSKWLSKALEKSEVSDINILLEAIEAVLWNPDLAEKGRNSLLSLQWKLEGIKESKEKDIKSAFDKFKGFIKDGDVKGLNKLKDNEIKWVIDFVLNESNWLQIFDLYKLMDGSKTSRTKSKNFNKVFSDIEDKYQTKIDEELWKEDLRNVFEGKHTANELNSLVVRYLWVNDWNWYNQFDHDDKFSCCGMRFSKTDFLRKFNEVNELRMDNNIDIIEKFNIDVSWQLSLFELSEWKLLYNWEPFDSWVMLNLFWELVDDLFGKLDFVEWEKEFLLNDIFGKVSDIIKEHISQNENGEQQGQINWEFVPLEDDLYGMEQSDYDDMNFNLGDNMFIKKSDDGDVSYNSKKAENYLKWIDRNKKWSEFLKSKWTYEWRAMISAIQILLNERSLGDKLVIDWKWWKNTILRVKDFQKNYNDNRPDWSLPLDVDGVPWRRTLTALLDGQYGDTIIEWLWRVWDWKFEFDNIQEQTDKSGRKYIVVDWIRYDEYREGMTWHWYTYGINDDDGWLGYIYIGDYDKGEFSGHWTFTWAGWYKYDWNYINDVCQWEWTYTWTNWNKYVWEWENDERTKWTFILNPWVNEVRYEVDRIDWKSVIISWWDWSKNGKYVYKWKIVDQWPDS